MSAVDLEAEYDNRARVTGSVAILARWLEAAEAARAELPVERDIAYGPSPRQVYDFFSAGAGSAAPLAVYIHGGYWQRGHGHDYAFVARELLKRGVSVAIPSYTLCPAVSIADIVAEMEQFIAALLAKTKCQPVIIGHSAGGHLAALLMAKGHIKAAIGLSGVYDLAPLIATSLNAALGLDATTARSLSPMLQPKPAHARIFVAAVGGDESSEFLRQSRDLAAAWEGGGVTARYEPVAGANHFTIVDELCRADSKIIDCAVGLAEALV